MKTEKTVKIEDLLIRHFIFKNKTDVIAGRYPAKEVQIGSQIRFNKSQKREIVDFMFWEEKTNNFYCFEIKVSKSDLNSDAALSFHGDFNYLVVPPELFEDALQKILDLRKIQIGIVVVDLEKESVFVKRKASRATVRGDKKAVLHWSLFRSMSRDVVKSYQVNMKKGEK